MLLSSFTFRSLCVSLHFPYGSFIFLLSFISTGSCCLGPLCVCLVFSVLSSSFSVIFPSFLVCYLSSIHLPCSSLFFSALAWCCDSLFYCVFRHFPMFFSACGHLGGANGSQTVKTHFFGISCEWNPESWSRVLRDLSTQEDELFFLICFVLGLAIFFLCLAFGIDP